MHILLAHNDYARPSGEEHALEMLAAMLESEGHRISWLRRSSAEIDDAVAARIRAGLSGVWSPASRRQLTRMLDEDRPDAVLVQNLYPLLSPSILKPCSDRDIPVVMRCPNYRLFCPTGLHMTAGTVCERCLGPGRELWCLLRNCEQSIPKSASYAIRNAAARLSGSIDRHVSVFAVLTEFQKKRFMDQGIAEERLVVVPNAAPQHFFDLPAGGGDHVSFMGRVAIEKGLEPFLAVAGACPDIPFAVAGAVKESAQSLVKQAPANVTFHGHLEGDALAAFLRRTRIMMSCSLWFEGFPNAVVQAMAAGRPVVASAIGAVSEIVGDSAAGRLYAPGDVDAAVSHVKALFSDASTCVEMGEAGRQRVSQNYNERSVYAGLMLSFERAQQLRASSK